MPAKSYSQTLTQHIFSDTLNVGDVFNFSIVLKKDRSYDDVIYPDSSLLPEGIELTGRKIYRVAGFEDSLLYKFQFWDNSDITLPALPVKLVADGDTTVMYTQPVTLHFQTVLRSDDANLRPLKPLFAFAAVWWPYLAGFLALLILIAIGYYIYQKYLQDEPEEKPEFKAEPFLDPLKELRENLNEVKEIHPDTEETFEQFYIELGDAVRLYFERLYQIPAMESTSREIIYALERKMEDERLVNQTRFVLRDADMVKFAKFTPSKEHANKTYQKAVDFLSIASEVHRARIQKMRRQHSARIEKARQEFEESQKVEVES